MTGGFERWCERHVRIQDKELGSVTAFKLWPGQQRVVPDLIAGVWLICLKGRQLGLTSIAAFYVAWRLVYEALYQVMVINQGKEYAIDFVSRVRWIMSGLPDWMQVTWSVDQKQVLEINENGRICSLRALVGSDKAGRSFTGDLMIADEAAFIPNFMDTLGAIMPTLARSNLSDGKRGQIVVLTTSSGPLGEFAKLWERTYGEGGELLDEETGCGPTGFKPIFLRWSERPGRDQAWYKKQEVELDQISKVRTRREYPDNPDEAFEYAEGRVFPLFTRARNVGRIDPLPEGVQRGRCIDWGETLSAYVVLWVALIPGPPGFLVSPDCPNTIREFIGYRFDENGKPMEEEDHTVDAARYFATTHNCRCLMYIYREIYRKDSVERGWNQWKEIAELHKLSGWTKAAAGSRRMYRPTRQAEEYPLSLVADASPAKMIANLNAAQIPTIPYRRFEADDPHAVGPGRVRKDRPIDQILEGLRWLAALIDGSEDMDKYHAVTREAAALRIYRETVERPDISYGLRERRMMEVAREILAGRAGPGGGT